MQQQPGMHPVAAATTLALGTGPDAEASTPASASFQRLMGDCSATITVQVTHDTVIFAAVLSMGRHSGVSQRWVRQGGTGQSWKLAEGPRLWTDEEERISTELADFMEAMSFPFALASMLPRKPSPTVAEAIAAAAREVGNA